MSDVPPAPSTDLRTTRLRWAVLGLLLGVVLASLVWVGWTVLDRGAGGNPVSKVDSLIDPPPAATLEREKALASGRDFVQRFETYGPDLLQADGTMPEYAAVADLMTAKFAKVFSNNVGYAEKTVADTGVDRKASVYAVGVASIDDDTATLLVAGTREFTYPSPDDEEERITFAPQQFRYEVSLIKSNGVWKVDDLDDVDDTLPSFSDSSDPEAGVPDPAPTDGASEDASEGAPGEESGGEQE